MDRDHVCLIWQEPHGDGAPMLRGCAASDAVATAIVTGLCRENGRPDNAVHFWFSTERVRMAA